MLTARYYACTIRHRTTVSVIKNKMLKRYLTSNFCSFKYTNKTLCLYNAWGRGRSCAMACAGRGPWAAAPAFCFIGGNVSGVFPDVDSRQAGLQTSPWRNSRVMDQSYLDQLFTGSGDQNSGARI